MFQFWNAMEVLINKCFIIFQRVLVNEVYILSKFNIHMYTESIEKT